MHIYRRIVKSQFVSLGVWLWGRTDFILSLHMLRILIQCFISYLIFCINPSMRVCILISNINTNINNNNKYNRYGQHGYEMINVTYQGDLLIAYKVTGDRNVPRGEITFQVDLSPVPPARVGGNNNNNNYNNGSSGTGTGYGPNSNSGGSGASGASIPNEPLQPISLTDKAAKKWGTTQLPRHKGLGQVAESGFTNNQWMDGQLIIIGEQYFSFAWVPIEQQIFFGRPSPELALKMLRESGVTHVTPIKSWEVPPSMDADVQVLKDYVTSCLEKTTEGVEEGELNGDPLSCIWTGIETEECYFQ
jgi:hypothetical protein